MSTFLSEKNSFLYKEDSTRISRREISIGKVEEGGYVLPVPCNWNSLFLYSTASVKSEFLDFGNNACLYESFLFTGNGVIELHHARAFTYDVKRLNFQL